MIPSAWSDLIVAAGAGFAVGIFFMWWLDRKVVESLTEERDAARKAVMYYVNKDK